MIHFKEFLLEKITVRESKHWLHTVHTFLWLNRKEWIVFENKLFFGDPWDWSKLFEN